MITSLSSNYKPMSECHQVRMMSITLQNCPHNPSLQSDYQPSALSESGLSNHEMTSISVVSPSSNMMETMVVHHQPDCHVLAKHQLAVGNGGDMFSGNNKSR